MTWNTSSTCAPPHPLGIATYTVTPQLSANYAADLASPEQIAQRLQGWGLDE